MTHHEDKAKKRRNVRLPNGRPELFMPNWLKTGAHNRIRVTEPEGPQNDTPKDKR